MVVESTFSHLSKLDLVDNVKALGYAVHVLPISAEKVEYLIARVAERVRKDGHPVPEDRIRRRFVRNQALIRQAVLRANRGRVLDSSLRNAPPRIHVAFANGSGSLLATPLPRWIEVLYGRDLQG